MLFFRLQCFHKADRSSLLLSDFSCSFPLVYTLLDVFSHVDVVIFGTFDFICYALSITRSFSIRSTYQAVFSFTLSRFTRAILDTLTTYQRDTLVLSLGKVLTRSSPDLFQRKVKVLKGRIWKVASASAAAALVPLPGLSFGVDAWLLLNELSFYRSQFGIPEEGSDEYKRLPFSTQEKVSKVSLTTIPQLVACLTAFTAEAAVEDYTRFVLILGSVIASSMSFTTTYLALKKLLKHVEEVTKIVMREAIKKAMAEIEAEID